MRAPLRMVLSIKVPFGSFPLESDLAAQPASFALAKLARGVSSAGRAPALQAGGHRFDPDTLHQHSIRLRIE